jgi:hypothetical protein
MSVCGSTLRCKGDTTSDQYHPDALRGDFFFDQVCLVTIDVRALSPRNDERGGILCRR